EPLAILLFLGFSRALGRKRVFFRLDGKLILAKASDGYSDAVLVLSGTLDVIRWVTRRGFKSVQHRKQPVESDGGTIKGSKIESSHGISSIVERHAVVRRMARPNRAQP